MKSKVKVKYFLNYQIFLLQVFGAANEELKEIARTSLASCQ